MNVSRLVLSIALIVAFAATTGLFVIDMRQQSALRSEGACVRSAAPFQGTDAVANVKWQTTEKDISHPTEVRSR